MKGNPSSDSLRWMKIFGSTIDVEREDLRRLLSVVFGSLIVSTGFTIVGKTAFEGDALGVASGYMGFIVGYKTIYYGTRESLDWNLDRERLRNHLYQENRNYMLMIAGVTCSAVGTVYFASAVTSFDILKASLGGFLVFAGYMVSHEGVNNVLV